MKKWFFVSLILFDLSFGQYQFSTKYFSTTGNYTDSLKSKTAGDSYFIQFELKNSIRVIAHLDNLQIKNSTWHYGQKNYLLNTTFSSYPWFYNFTVAQISGKFDYQPSIYSYNDNSNLYSAGLTYYKNLWYFGGQITHLSARGILTSDLLTQQKINSLTLRVEKYLTPQIFLSFKPHFANLSDGRNLTSLGGEVTYFPFEFISLNAGGFIGKRAYFFNSDLLTLFNQNETQLNQIKGQINITPIKEVTFSAIYQKTKFETFSIKYLTLGATFKIDL